MKKVTHRGIEALVFSMLSGTNVETHRDIENGIEFVIPGYIDITTAAFAMLTDELRVLGVKAELRGCAFWDGPASIELTITWGPDEE